ncbi:MAG TPA: hypothetical protein VK449_01580, partial [Anaerolineales bacterium]|nr:hypothetical protein [Anaerolineales bacterium]
MTGVPSAVPPGPSPETASTEAGARPRRMGGVERLVPWILAAVALVQVGLLTSNFVWPRALQAWPLRARPAWERSALLSEGADFLAYVTFL